MDVLIGAARTTLGKKIAEGGEAYIYRVGSDAVAKVYKLPSDPALDGDDVAIHGARVRLVVAQQKLMLFPRDLPQGVVGPTQLVRDVRNGLTIGYTMTFIEEARTLAEVAQKDQRGSSITDEDVLAIMLSLATKIRALHDRGIIIGDFNDTNVLVRGRETFVIDADSMQFGPYRGKVFMPQFVDPDLCNEKHPSALVQIREHTKDSDWFAWWVMLFQATCFVHPYGGVYKPSSSSSKCPAGLRGLPQHRISVFHPEVIYPKQARPLGEIPVHLLEAFKRVFVEGSRNPPASALRAKTTFKHGSLSLMVAPAAQTEVNARNVKVETTAKYSKILASDQQHEEMLVLACDEHGCVRREDNSMLFKEGAVSPEMQFLFARGHTIAVHGVDALVFWGQAVVNAKLLKGLRGNPLIAGSAEGIVYFDEAGTLRALIGRDTPSVKTLALSEQEVVGLQIFNRTAFVLYSNKGKLRYRAHNILWDAQVFDKPFQARLVGDLEEAQFYFDGTNIALVARWKESFTIDVLASDGKIEASADLDDEQAKQLGSTKGKCLVQRAFFSADTEGVRRVNLVTSAMTLFPASGLEGAALYRGASGLIAVNDTRISNLRMS